MYAKAFILLIWPADTNPPQVDRAKNTWMECAKTNSSQRHKLLT